MKLIAHRGLINGPSKNFENQPVIVRSALAAGFDAEVDLWVVDGNLYLGHDAPQYHVTVDFINTDGLWIHAKSLETLTWLSTVPYALNYFWHQNDDYVVTSRGYIWTYPGKMTNERCVVVMPEWDDPKLEKVKDLTCYAVCSDYVSLLK